MNIKGRERRKYSEVVLIKNWKIKIKSTDVVRDEEVLKGVKMRRKRSILTAVFNRQAENWN